MQNRGKHNPLVGRTMEIKFLEDAAVDGEYEILYLGQGMIRLRNGDKHFWTPIETILKIQDPTPEASQGRRQNLGLRLAR